MEGIIQNDNSKKWPKNNLKIHHKSYFRVILLLLFRMMCPMYPMHDVQWVHVSQAIQQLLQVGLDLGQSQGVLGVTNQLWQVRDHEVEDQNQTCRMWEHVTKADDLNGGKVISHICNICHYAQINLYGYLGSF